MNGKETWLADKKMGLFGHYLAAPAGNGLDIDRGVDDWNRRVDAFDTEKLAEQLKEVGVDYFGITIGQNSGYYCSPNKVYDELVEISPSKCSRRDLIQDLAEALEKRGIDLIVYLPSGAPDGDERAMEKLEWRWGYEGEIGDYSKPKREDRQVSFQKKWQRIIREWSERWGDQIKGWWIDGCYYSDKMYLFEDEPNFHSFAAALRAGNENAVLAFNTGLDDPFVLETEEADYTAGEVANLFPLGVRNADTKEKIQEKLQGKKWHILSYLGESWGQGSPRMPAFLAAGYTQYVNERGGMISWDLPLSYDGTISEEWMAYLKKVQTIRNQ